ncbi:hypothetical protein B0T22DRAFT_42956 [Podospora appendiculata]|uniref:Uncharacterized protein n=1 Tax=Podospora appendiculata TaxID=314037 RepID=A0AAE0XHH8_9PEZI|nr:hypothetical protein B0T22DRAFT_42956 [Podospora appendiculata]
MLRSASHFHRGLQQNSVPSIRQSYTLISVECVHRLHVDCPMPPQPVDHVYSEASMSFSNVSDNGIRQGASPEAPYPLTTVCIYIILSTANFLDVYRSPGALLPSEWVSLAGIPAARHIASSVPNMLVGCIICHLPADLAALFAGLLCGRYKVSIVRKQTCQKQNPQHPHVTISQMKKAEHVPTPSPRSSAKNALLNALLALVTRGAHRRVYMIKI